MGHNDNETGHAPTHPEIVALVKRTYQDMVSELELEHGEVEAGEMAAYIAEELSHWFSEQMDPDDDEG